jgi:hypothetical protein
VAADGDPSVDDDEGEPSSRLLAAAKVGATLILLCVFVATTAVHHRAALLLRNLPPFTLSRFDAQAPPQGTTAATRSSTTTVGTGAAAATVVSAEQDRMREWWITARYGSDRDAFGAWREFRRGGENNSEFWSEAGRLLGRFRDRYSADSERAARNVLQRSLSELEPGKTVHKWARRLQHRQRNGLSIVVLGSSAAAGIGNYREQSYPFLLESLLTDVAQSIGWNLSVQSVTFQDTTEFPLTWCLADHYLLTESPDVVVWDFGASTSSAAGRRLEAFIRYTSTLWREEPPLYVFRGIVSAEQWAILQHYTEHNVLQAALLLHEEHAAAGMLELPSEASRPTGFSEWDKYGVTTNTRLKSSGRPEAAPLPGLQQHEFIAWLIEQFWNLYGRIERPTAKYFRT